MACFVQCSGDGRALSGISRYLCTYVPTVPTIVITIVITITIIMIYHYHCYYITITRYGDTSKV